MSKETLVFCSLKDCIFYASDKGDGKAICNHPDFTLTNQGRRCPLYRMDWQKTYMKVLEKTV